MEDPASSLSAAVERAARAAFFCDDENGHIQGRWTYDTIPEKGRQDYRKMTRAALTAAHLPELLAVAEAAKELQKGSMATWGNSTHYCLQFPRPAVDAFVAALATLAAVTEETE